MAETIELTAESTAEDMEAVIDQIEADIAPEEEATEETSDADRFTSDEVVEHEDTAEDDEDDVLADDSEKTGDDWRTDDVVSEASGYGISEEELAEFGSREELDRALNLFDRKVEAKPEDKGGKDQKDEPKSDDDGTVKLDRDVYDDAIVDEFDRMHKHYDSRFAALEERLQLADAKAEEAQFDSAVDGLEFSKLFGKTGSEGKAEKSRREKLLTEVRIQEQALADAGRTPDYGALVERVARGIFPDDYDKKVIQKQTRRLSRQSDRRQGGSVTRPSDPPEDPREEADRLFRQYSGT